MNYTSFQIEYMPTDRLMTELRFDIASARALGSELVRIELAPEDAKVRARLRTSVLVRLRALKKEGVIQFCATDRDFKEESTEAVYLLNKYPELEADAALANEGELRAIIIRL